MGTSSPDAGSRPAHPTQADVAREAGVSRALVGIVFRNQPGASQANRDYIRTVAAAIGYVPDQRAQLLSRKRTGIIGVSYSLTHDFHSTTVEHLYQSAEKIGLSLILSGYGATRSEQSAVSNLLAYRCEGVVLVGSSCSTRDLEQIAQQVPTVLIFRSMKRPGVGVVRTDDLAASCTATEHLLGLGHRRLIHINGATAPGANERRKGFRQTVEHNDLIFEELRGGSTDEDGLKAGRALADRMKRTGAARSPTAAVVFNDESAVGVIAAVRAAGITVPDDLSVVGFDDSRLAGIPGVSLTTMRQDTAALAHHAIDQLAARTHDHELLATEVVIPADLVLRSTTDVPPLAEAS